MPSFIIHKRYAWQYTFTRWLVGQGDYTVMHILKSACGKKLSCAELCDSGTNDIEIGIFFIAEFNVEISRCAIEWHEYEFKINIDNINEL